MKFDQDQISRAGSRTWSSDRIRSHGFKNMKLSQDQSSRVQEHEAQAGSDLTGSGTWSSARIRCHGFKNRFRDYRFKNIFFNSGFYKLKSIFWFRFLIQYYSLFRLQRLKSIFWFRFLKQYYSLFRLHRLKSIFWFRFLIQYYSLIKASKVKEHILIQVSYTILFTKLFFNSGFTS